MKVLKYIFCSAIVLSLTGCAVMETRDHNDDYQKSQTVKPMKMPSGVSSSDVKSYYPVPAVKSNDAGGDISLVPPGAKKL